MKNIKKIAIFDFDGTLVRTQMPEDGKVIWKNTTGNDWPHVGWWSKKESLDTNVFNQEPILAVIEAYHNHNDCDETLMVMLTGRRTHLSVEVEQILNDNDLSFDKYLYNYGGATLQNKIEQIDKLIKEFSDVECITLFDDRFEHIPTFKDHFYGLMDSKVIELFDIYHVDEDGNVNQI